MRTSLRAGDVAVSGGRGEIDATIETQLSRVIDERACPLRRLTMMEAGRSHECRSRAWTTLSHVEPMGITGSVAVLRGLTMLVDDLPVEAGTLVSIGTGRRISSARWWASTTVARS